MNTTLEERKEKAVELMNQLKIYKPYINGFKAKNSKVCYFENFGGYWAFQDEELIAKVRDFEEKHNCTVYAITHEFTEFGELYDFLIVTDYKEEWDSLLTSEGAVFYAYAYSWNKTDDFCSEFGDIAVVSMGGGIRRVG